MSPKRISNTSHSLHSHSEKIYLMNQLVTVIKVYPQFGLAKVKYPLEDNEFIIDSSLLSIMPDNTHTLSLRLLGGF